MKLREARIGAGKRQIDVYLLTGISQSKFSGIERGVLIPTDQERWQIASALELTPDQIQWGEV